MKSIHILGLALGASIAMSTAAFAQDISVAVAGPMTGSESAFGRQMKNGADLAVADLNAAGGVNGKKLALQVGDDACDPKQARSVAEKLASSKVQFVAGHFCSSSSIPASEAYAEGNVLQITPASTNPVFTERKLWNVLRVCGRDDQQGLVAAQYILKAFAGKNVAILGQSCFAGDSAINDITCYAAQPPMVYDQTFAGVPDTAVLRVLPASVSAYKSAQYWSRFRIVAMDADEYIQNKVTVDAGETTANFTWPTDAEANSYQIDIYKDGTVFCKLTLGPKGQLLGIDFSGPDVDISIPAPKRSQDSDVPATLSFMVTGLDKASRYNYVLSTLAADDKPLHVYIGDFATIGYEGELNPDSGNEVLPTPPIIPYDPESTPLPTGDAVNNASAIHGGSETTALQLMRNGRLLFVTPSGTYDITGKRIE